MRPERKRHGPRQRSEYGWSLADKRMLVTLRLLNCNYHVIGVQLHRTPAECEAMYDCIVRLRLPGRRN